MKALILMSILLVCSITTFAQDKNTILRLRDDKVFQKTFELDRDGNFKYNRTAGVRPEQGQVRYTVDGCILTARLKTQFYVLTITANSCDGTGVVHFDYFTDEDQHLEDTRPYSTQTVSQPNKLTLKTRHDRECAAPRGLGQKSSRNN